MFAGCGLFPVAETDALVMLENRQNEPERFVAPFCRSEDGEQVVGSAVMEL